MVAVLLGVVGTPASAQTFQVLVEDSVGSDTFTAVGTVDAFDDSGNTVAGTYNYGGFRYQGTIVTTTNETAKLFIVRNSDGNLHAYWVNGHDDVAGSAGAAQGQISVTGTNSVGPVVVELEDDPNDTYTPVANGFTMDWDWGAQLTDGGVFGPLDDAPSAWTLDAW